MGVWKGFLEGVTSGRDCPLAGESVWQKEQVLESPGDTLPLLKWLPPARPFPQTSSGWLASPGTYCYTVVTWT
jgi:hypothetical protein